MLKLRDQKYKSKIQFATLSPVWNETLQLCVESLDDVLKIEMFDYDRLTHDDFMGRTELALATAKDGTNRVHTLDLQDTKHGCLHIEVSFISLK